MIPVTRLPKPAILMQKESLWLTALQNAKTKKAKECALEKYRHKQVRQTLNSMFHGKCAFCESKITHVSYPHIEHYRPKSRFPHLTFDWANLLLACAVCNSAEWKGDRFPEAQDGGPLINPCTDNPEEHFVFSFDTKTALATVSGTTDRGRITEEICGLNRPDLLTYRSKQVQRLACLAELSPNNTTAHQLLMEAMQESEEYSAFARALVTAPSTSLPER